MRKNDNQRKSVNMAALAMLSVVMSFLFGCAQPDYPAARNAKIPSPTMASERPDAVNEKPDSVIYLPLGSDVLVPETLSGEALPSTNVGPFELRSETLAGALQLILADYEIPMAFETDEGLNRTITVTNLRGPLDRVVQKVCGLADLYCAFEDGVIVVKETQTFTVTIPPVGGDNILSDLASGLQAITGSTPITENATRTIIYEATNRTANLAERYFQKLRANTALIVFEIYIWEVALDSSNAMGINWEEIETFGKFTSGFSIPSTEIDGSAVSIGLPTTGDFSFGASDVLQFISNYGAVKTISQPQITVLSGSEATLRAADTENYVSSISRSVDNGDVTVSTETDSVDTGFTITIQSAWDKATVYGNIDIELQQVLGIDNFSTTGGTEGDDDEDEGSTSSSTVQLPRTTERELNTQVRIRPGDSLLIAGLVSEGDSISKRGPGFQEPLFPMSKTSEVSNTEVVFLLRPRVIVYTAEGHKMEQRDTVVTDDFGNVLDGITGGLPVMKEEEFPEGSITTDVLNPGN